MTMTPHPTLAAGAPLKMLRRPLCFPPLSEQALTPGWTHGALGRAGPSALSRWTSHAGPEHLLSCTLGRPAALPPLPVLAPLWPTSLLTATSPALQGPPSLSHSLSLPGPRCQTSCLWSIRAGPISPFLPPRLAPRWYLEHLLRFRQTPPGTCTAWTPLVPRPAGPPLTLLAPGHLPPPPGSGSRSGSPQGQGGAPEVASAGQGS